MEVLLFQNDAKIQVIIRLNLERICVISQLLTNCYFDQPGIWIFHKLIKMYPEGVRLVITCVVWRLTSTHNQIICQSSDKIC